ncbi:hypothetical protein [Limosilactobacillus walteri]|uniref:hypothetical protein n=1 Tax=Limosilactobacillus walteri TaxID=2268022 RepID=UPI001562B95B|nr:hypothetical protein [Limosilactobacillus walteri]
MNKEHGQVTGLVWRGTSDLEVYQQLKRYADSKSVPVSVAAKQLIKEALVEK